MQFPYLCKVFDTMSNESVVDLVNGLIALPDSQNALAQLHYAFDNRYWKRRYEIECKTSYYYEQIVTPEVIGLVHFADLLIRHINLVDRKSNMLKVEIDDNDITILMVGNHYFLYEYKGCSGTNIHVRRVFNKVVSAHFDITILNRHLSRYYSR